MIFHRFAVPLRLTGLTLMLLLGASAPAAPDDALLDSPTGFTPQEMAQGYSDRKILAGPATRPGQTYDDSAEAALLAAEEAEGYVTERVFTHLGGIRVILVPDGLSVEAARSQLAATGRYDFVEYDQLRQTVATPNDPAFADGSQWHLRNTGQTGGTVGADLGTVTGWDTRSDASGVIVAVIDSGVRLDHADLAPNLWTNPGEIAGNGRDDDNNGYIDDVHGIDARIALRTSGNGDPNDTDSASGHGTHVAGIIGAVGNNGVAGSGVAWRVQLMALRFLGGTEGTGAISDGIECIDYAIAKGADVINASYGALSTDQDFSQAELAAIKRARDAGIVFVAAAGNDTLNLDISRAYPASFAVDNLIAVGNSTRLDDIATSSNFGSGAVELFAPGSEIVSTSNADPSSTRVLSGTSMAAPAVSGIVALLRAQYPQDDYRQIINRLLRGVTPAPAFAGKAQTGGRANLAGAFAANDSRPFNDDFANRARLTGNVITARGSSAYATTQSGEPAHVGRLSRSLWYEWTAPASGLVTVDTRDSTVDTQVSVYTGISLNGLSLVADNDNGGDGFLTSRVTFLAQTGVTYPIAVDSTSAGLVMLNLAAASANDAFGSAQPLEGDAPIVTTTNANATRQTGEPLIASSADGRTLWYRWEAPYSGTFQASVYAAAMDAALGVYTGTSVNALTRIAGTDDSGPDGININPTVNFTATGGTTYHLAVDSIQNTAGEFTLTLTDAVWQYVTGSDEDDASRRPTVTNAPALGADGTVYFGSSDGFFYAINSKGTLKWRFDNDGFMDSSAPAVAPDGTIYFGTITTATSGTAYALNPDGSVRWSNASATGTYVAPPAIALDGTVYFKNDDGNLQAFAPDGTLRWTYFTAGVGSYAGPAVTANGTIILPANDGALHAVNAAGTRVWRYQPQTAGGEDDTTGIYSSPAIDTAGNLYACTLQGTFFSLTPNGTERWVFRSPAENVSSSAALGDGRVYFASYGGELYALDQTDGSVIWTRPIEAQARASSPAIGNDGSIFIGSYANILFRFSRDGDLLRSWSAGNWFRSSPLLADGRVYIGNGDGKLYAFDLEGLSPASGDDYPWPQHRHSPRRLARRTVEPIGQVITPAPDDPGRLVNLSVRNRTARGVDALTAGFVLQGSVTKELIVRAVGPGLVDLGVPGTVEATELQLFTFGDSVNPIATNLNWSDATGDGRELGAFPLETGSADSVVRQAVGSAGYTATAVPRGNAGEPGVALIEVYDTQTDELRTRLLNLSARTRLAPNDTITAGFVIDGATPRTVLIRAIGPGLAALGVPGTLADPKLTLFSGSVPESANDDWGGTPDLETASDTVGAFAIPRASRDAALLATLPPGLYTAQVTGPSNQGGIVLVEVYLLPDE